MDTGAGRERATVREATQPLTLPMRFLLDEDLNPAVAGIGRSLGLDVISVHELDRRGFTDEEQLRFAVAERRTFVTRNRDDFIRLTVSFFQTGQLHHGILIVPHSLPNHRPARIAHALERWANRPGDPGLHFLDFLSGSSNDRGSGSTKGPL